MKKLLIFLIISLTSFVFCDHVGATSYNGYVDYSNLYSTSKLSNIPIYARYSGNNVNYEDTTEALNQLPFLNH